MSNQQQSSIGSDKGYPIRRKDIICSNDGLVYWRISESLGRSALRISLAKNRFNIHLKANNWLLSSAYLRNHKLKIDNHIVLTMINSFYQCPTYNIQIIIVFKYLYKCLSIGLMEMLTLNLSFRDAARLRNVICERSRFHYVMLDLHLELLNLPERNNLVCNNVLTAHYNPTGSC